MNQSISKFFIFTAVMCLSLPATSNEIIDVGTGLIPDYDPLKYDSSSGQPAWTLSSSCVDINEDGQAACRAVAVGPTYRCGFRGIKTCGSSVAHVHRWNGVSLELMSDLEALGDTPLAMNNAGEIVGYEYQGAVYPRSGSNGRIWHAPFNTESTSLPVSAINDRGDYILKDIEVLGGVAYYSATVHDASGAMISYPGSTLLPTVIANTGDAIGGQIIQEYQSELSTTTGDEVPEVSGVGWMLNQDDVDALELNEEGLFDVDRDRLWQLLFFRPNGFSNYSTIANDANDFADFVAVMNFGGLHNSYYCTREGETVYTDNLGTEHLLPWVCDGTNYHGGTYAGGKLYRGINNHGDIVGAFTPGVYGYSSNITRHPWVWLVNETGGLDEYNVNDLLPQGSGYTVLSINDINDNREIAGSCENAAGEKRGCIIKLTDLPVPADSIAPTVRIDSALSGSLSGVVSIEASAWDRQSRIKKVKFKLGEDLLGIDESRPYSLQWDASTVPSGTYTLKVTAVDNAGNRSSSKMTITVGGSVVTPVPDPEPAPAPDAGTGESVEGEGTILAIGTNYLDTSNARIFYDAATVVKFNDVDGFAEGLPLQYKGVQDSDGIITATKLEVN